MEKKIGNYGEKLAVRYLKKKGYQIIEKNFRQKWGEIDIICFDKKTKEIVFIEVKTRKSNSLILPEENLTFFKKQKIKKAILSYFLKNRYEEVKWRFDLVAILISNFKPLKYQVNHYINQEVDFP